MDKIGKWSKIGHARKKKKETSKKEKNRPLCQMMKVEGFSYEFELYSFLLAVNN